MNEWIHTLLVSMYRHDLYRYLNMYIFFFIFVLYEPIELTLASCSPSGDNDTSNEP